MIGVAPSYMDIHPLAHHYGVPVFAQHVDGHPPGAFTGHITAEALRQAGAAGSLVNHSERRLTLAAIESSVVSLREKKLLSVICTNNTPVSAAAAALGPDYVAIEPPELIGAASLSRRRTPISSAGRLRPCGQSTTA